MGYKAHLAGSDKVYDSDNPDEVRAFQLASGGQPFPGMPTSTPGAYTQAEMDAMQHPGTPGGTSAYSTNTAEPGQTPVHGVQTAGQAPASTYGNYQNSMLPVSGANPMGGVTDSRLPQNYSGNVYDPFAYGGNGGKYVNGVYQQGSDGFTQRATGYNGLAQAAANRSAYQTGTANTANAMGLLQGAAQGNAPSQAEMLGRNQLDQGLNSELAAASGARGGGLAQAMALRQAQMGRAGEVQQGMNSLAAMRANEMANARSAYSGYAGNMAQMQAQSEMGQRQLNQQGQLAFSGLADNALGAGVASNQAKAGLALGQYNTQQASQLGQANADRAYNGQLIGAGIGAGAAVRAAQCWAAFSEAAAKAVGPASGGGGSIGADGGASPSDGGGGAAPPGASNENDNPNYSGAGGSAYDPYADPHSDVTTKEGVTSLSAPKSPISDEEAARLGDEGQKMMANPYYTPPDMKKGAGISQAAAAKLSLAGQAMGQQIASGRDAAMGNQSATQAALERNPASAIQPADDPMANANRSRAPYAFQYKPEYTPAGHAPGEQRVGVMAQNMAQDPIASQAVYRGPDGKLKIDSGKELQQHGASIGSLQQQQDQTRVSLAQIAAMYAQLRAQQDAAAKYRPTLSGKETE